MSFLKTPPTTATSFIPLVTRLLDSCGKTNANVKVLTNPRAEGYEHAKSLLLDQVPDRYVHFNLLLFLPDADGKDRSGEFERLEAAAAAKRVNLLCCAAKQEVEVWLLAGHVEKLSRTWKEVRGDVSVKENIFMPSLTAHGDARRAGGGRDLLMMETLRNFSGLLKRRPELERLRRRIVALTGTR